MKFGNTVKNLFITFGASVAIQLVTIVSGVLTARFLGPKGKGELTAVFLWAGVLALLGNLGISQSIVYFSAKEKEEKAASIFSNGVAACVLQTIVLIALGLWLIPVLMKGYSESTIKVARLYLLFIPLNLLGLYTVGLIQGRLMMRVYNFLRFLVHGAYSAGVLLIVVFGLTSVRNFALASLTANFLTVAVAVIYIRRLNWLKWCPDFGLLRRMLSYGIKAHIGDITSMLNLRLDQILIAAFLSPVALGLYAVAVTVSNAVNLISNSIFHVAWPSISQDKDRQLVLFGQFFRINLFLSAVATIGLILLIPWIVRFFFGDSFSPCIPAARVLTLASIAYSMNIIFNAGYKALGRPLVSTYSEIIGLIATALFLWILLPRFQIMGAAIASLLAYLSSSLFFFWYSWRRLRLSPLKLLWPQTEDMVYLRTMSRHISLMVATRPR